MVTHMDFLVNSSYSWDGVHIDFGVISDINLFEPNKPVTYAVRFNGVGDGCRDAEVLITCEDIGFYERKNIILSSEVTTGSFTPEKNGLYRIKLIPLSLDMTLEFNVAVMPRAKRAKDSFSFSCQPYIARTMTETLAFNGMDYKRTAKYLLDVIDYMGFNAIREDSIYWCHTQKEPYGEVDFTLTDRLVDICREHDLTLHWIFMGSVEWAWKDEYKKLDEVCYNVCPKTELWVDYVRKFAKHYSTLEPGRIIYEIWNEPDWEFFCGTKEEFAEILEATARTIREVDKNVFTMSGGLTAPINFDTDFKWYNGGTTLVLQTAKRLIEEGILNTYATHLHYGFNRWFFEFMENGIGLAERQSGIVNNGAFNTESGVSTPDDDLQSRDNVAKALWFRSHGYGGFTHFAISDFGYGEDGFAIMRGFVPRKSLVSYTVMLGMIGQAVSRETISDDRSIFAELYYDGENSIVTVYNDSEPPTGVGVLHLPEGKRCRAYDLYGNPIEVSGSVKAQAAVKYLVFEGKLSAGDFRAETAAIGACFNQPKLTTQGKIW